MLGSVSERLERCCCFFQFMRGPNLGATHTVFHQESIFDVPYNKNNS